MKKIVYITGSRAEYGTMKELLRKINKNSSFNLSLIVTGMHLSKDFGFTLRDIKKDGFKVVATVKTNLNDNTSAGMAKSLGYAMVGITNVLDKLKPQLVLIAGDRGEVLIAAVAASYLNIPIAHISGGDTTTGAMIDERFRHAITKLADIHFPANKKSARNIIKMGENPKCVFPVGNPGIPIVYHLSNKKRREIARKYDLDLKHPLFLVIQHPVTIQKDLSTDQMKKTMEAIKELRMQTIVIYPNSDPGSKNMIKIIHKYEHLDFIQVYRNIEHDDFQGLMALSDVIIGNSSCALLEAPSFGLPAVNIGIRQEGRERSFNVINVSHNKKEIIRGIKKALSKGFQKKIKKSLSPYAKKGAEESIIKILEKTDLSEFPRKKFKKVYGV